MASKFQAQAVQLVGLTAKLQMFIARTELIFCLLHERKKAPGKEPCEINKPD
jgi:hypothetical protein